MFFPYSTDAPIYYLPIGTVCLIVINVVLFPLAGGDLDPGSDWVLMYGEGINPIQWLLSRFMHGDLMHLIGNMLFLWAFGIIVEGKLAWYRFVPCYLFIAVTQAALEQFVMLGYDGLGGSIGASGAIFGIMAMAAVWAPKNDMTCAYWFVVFVGVCEIPIAILAAIYVGYDLTIGMLFGGSAMTSWIHLSGAAIGFPLGILLLKRGIVDCEGWDIFHVWNDNIGEKDEPEPKVVAEKLAKVQASRDAKQIVSAREQVRTYLQNDNVEAAARLCDKMRIVGTGVTLDHDELFAIIRGLHKLKKWRESAPFMAELIARFPKGTESVRVKLAQISVVELQRPGKALELLQPLVGKTLPPELEQLAAKIAAKAKQMQMAGEVELDTETW